MAAIAQSIALLLFLSLAYLSHGGITSRFMRKLEASVDMPAEAFPPPSGHNAPEQVSPRSSRFSATIIFRFGSSFLLFR